MWLCDSEKFGPTFISSLLFNLTFELLVDHEGGGKKKSLKSKCLFPNHSGGNVQQTLLWH